MCHQSNRYHRRRLWHQLVGHLIMPQCRQGDISNNKDQVVKLAQLATTTTMDKGGAQHPQRLQCNIR